MRFAPDDAMSSCWTDYTGNSENVTKCHNYFSFPKIEDKHAIDHWDSFETSTFTRNWSRRCLKEGDGTGVECADGRVVLEIVTLEERTPGKHSPLKKRPIARDEPSCSYCTRRILSCFEFCLSWFLNCKSIKKIQISEKQFSSTT